jgi:excisionase family DNA binding protein
LSPDTYTTEQAAARIGCSRQTLYAYFESGLLSRSRPGKKVLIPAEEVERLASFPDAARPLVRRIIACAVVEARESGLPVKPALHRLLGELQVAVTQLERTPKDD